MAPSRDAIATAIGKVIFLRLSKEDSHALFREKLDWAVVQQFTRQALTSTVAAASLSSHFVEHLTVLNAALEPQMYLGGANPCVADVVVLYALIPVMLAFGDEHKWALCNVSRWFDHMQHTVGSLSPPASLDFSRKASFNYEVPDALPRPASLRPLVGAPGSAAAASSSSATAADAPTGAGAEDAARAEKKAAEAPPPAEPAATQSDVSKLDMRVGLILSAERHPEAEKLYVEKVDVGEEKPRTVVSGLVDYMPASALTNRRAVLLCNLKPAKMRGIESQAMVLAASDEAHTKVELLVPPDAVAVGERVFFDGHPGEPLPPNQIAKKKVWEAVQPDLSTSAERVALYKDLPFLTSQGPCTVATIQNGKIK